MSDALTGLLFLSLAWAVYAQAKRAGTWSWPVARRVFLGAGILVVLVLPFTWYVVATVGRRHPWVSALEVLLLCVVGVTLLVLVVVPRRS